MTASDLDGSTQTRNVSATVTAVNEQPPAFTTAAEFKVTKNITEVGTVLATHDGVSTGSLAYSLTSGAEDAWFSIDPDIGELTYVIGTDGEPPGDLAKPSDY